MSRVRLVLLLAAVASIALVGTALGAKALKVTGGTATVTPSQAAATLLASNGITVTPVAPATASSGTFTFPIAGGRLTAKKLHGVLRESGGLDVSNATATVRLRRLRLLSSNAGVFLYALVRRPPASCRPYAIPHGHRRCHAAGGLSIAKIARITGISVANGSATGTVHVTAATAAIVNRLAGQNVVSPGAVLGTTTVTPSFG